MTLIYSPEYTAKLKHSGARRTALLLLCCAAVIGAYVYSLIGPQLYWLSLIIAVIGTAACCAVWIFALSPISDRLRLLKSAANGLSSTETLTFERAEPDAEYERIMCKVYVFSSRDERGNTFERRLYCENEFNLTIGQSYSLCTWCSLIMGIETAKGTSI